jgi:hypothetical protein
MNRIIRQLLPGILLMVLGSAFAQVGKPLDQPAKKPVLYDDVHNEAIKSANAHLIKKPSLTKRLPDLTAKQKRKILALEMNRDKELKQIDNRMAEMNKRASGSQEEITRLKSQRSNVEENYQKRIRSLLTGKQKKVFDRIEKK